MNNAKLFIISAPSGCGKGTILSEVFKDSDAYYSVSCTTRKPREEDTDGITYHFMTRDEFESEIKNDGFLEYAEFADNYYGTPRAATEKMLESGRDVVLEIETQGAFQVKKLMPDAVSVFILPPSIKELDRRLHKRGTEDDDTIKKRVSRASGEISKAYEYDYVIMNDELDDAIRDLKLIVDCTKNENSNADRFKAVNMKKIIDEVLKNA